VKSLQVVGGDLAPGLALRTMTVAVRTPVEPRIVDPRGGASPRSRSAFAASIRRRRTWMIIASTVPRCSLPTIDDRPHALEHCFVLQVH
jgi:hypothetical protein